MKNSNLTISLILGSILIILLSACGGAGSSNAIQAAVVESYIKALVAKDIATLSNLSCADWEENALMEFDSFLAYDEIKLEGLICTEIGEDGGYTLVNCQGSMNFSYFGEKEQNIDLSPRNYRLLDQNGEYLVCGYQ